MSGARFNNSLPEKIRDTFTVMRSSADAGRLAHGYIVSSEQPGWGEELVRLMLQWLFCREAERPCGRCRACLHVDARTQPDAHWIEPESKSRAISIDQVRALNAVMYQKSFEGGWKAAVIVDADRMTDNAANAFLKTLEEPPPNSLLMLVTGSAQKLLPTIISRCQRVDLGSGGSDAASSTIEQAMLAWLRKREQGAMASSQAAWISAILDEVRTRADKAEKERAGDEADEDLLKARIQARVIEARLEILRILYKWERDLLVCSFAPDRESLHYPAEYEILVRQGQGLSVADKLERVAKVEKATKLLDGNVPEATVWEAVLPV